ncbi:SurA N-terminal domain-containing protein [Actinorugispora endophytica]|uniref:SurA-like protein n=1 Tax=Actinorugispora endophytica TaxID=1605990 RepID=A0A4R6V3U8_9ACTN|nr:SurA N-terminal domain-containing protein [Actinorugispora endophytica]TDQ54853.1 SurA-like protein [Actinorugispora endophytica]
MRPTSPRRRTALAAAAAAAMLLSTGCVNGQAGAAAVVGDQRIGNEQIEAEVAEVEELAASFGQEIPQEQRSQLASGLLRTRIVMTVMEQLADAEGITVAADDTRARLAELGGRDALADQGLTDSQIDDQVTMAVIGDALVGGAAPGEIGALEDGVRDGLRDQLTEQGRLQGVPEEDLERQVEEELERQEPSIRVQASNLYLNERIQPYLTAQEVSVSPRYGVIDPATLEITPGASPLSAPEAAPASPTLPGQ